MGHKVHPYSLRIGIIRGWQSRWFARGKIYTQLLQEDMNLRKAIFSRYARGDVARVEVERNGNEVTVLVFTARPGIVIGRGGQRVDELRSYLEKLLGRRVRLNIQEIREPELDAYLVACSIAEQLERRVSFRRAMKQAITRSLQRNAKGIRVICAGRLAGAELARREMERQGRVPLHTLRADIDYGNAEARTALGRVGVKVWIYKGDILKEPAAPPMRQAPETARSAHATTQTSEIPEAAPGAAKG